MKYNYETYMKNETFYVKYKDIIISYGRYEIFSLKYFGYNIDTQIDLTIDRLIKNKRNIKIKEILYG